MLKSADNIKTLVYELKDQVNDLFLIVGADLMGKAHISVMISDNLIQAYKLDARTIIREIASEIEGGGGGQPFYATAGGKKPEGIGNAISKALEILQRNIPAD